MSTTLPQSPPQSHPQSHPQQSQPGVQTGTQPHSPPSKYRFSAVDDLQLPPALSVTPSTPLNTALTMALEREYSQLTVISPERRKLLGYLDVQQVLGQLNDPQGQHNGGQHEGQGPQDQGQHESQGPQGRGEDELLVRDVYTRFDRRKSVGYTVITPDTSLDILEDFLKTQKFAIVTDDSRKFVLGVATQSDLEEYAKRRVY